MFKRLIILLIAVMFVSSFNSLAISFKWNLKSELDFYNEYYKDKPGLIGTVVGNINDSIDKKTYNNFHQTLQHQDFTKFEKVYIYYELDGHDAYYFFMAIGGNGDYCHSFYTSKQIQKKSLDKCRDLKLVIKPQKVELDQLIIHGAFIGLYIQEKHKRPMRFHVIDPHIYNALKGDENIFDKIEMLFNN